MAATKYNNDLSDEKGREISEAGLRGRQSVRTTFRLPVHLIELLGAVAGLFGVKQKSLFDQLVEDSEVLLGIAGGVALYPSEAGERRPKTYVLSKRSLSMLEKIAAERSISRDTLVEISIRRLLPVLLSEQEKHGKRVKILGAMEQYLRRGQQLLAETEKLLGKNDPAYELVDRMVSQGEEKVRDLRDMVAKGKALEKVARQRFTGGVLYEKHHEND